MNIVFKQDFSQSNIEELINKHKPFMGVSFCNLPEGKRTLSVLAAPNTCNIILEDGGWGILFEDRCLRIALKNRILPYLVDFKSSINKMQKVLGDTPEVLYMQKKFDDFKKAFSGLELEGGDFLWTYEPEDKLR